MKTLPPAKQEQLIAELVATRKRRAGLSEEERDKEDAENEELRVKIEGMMATMDPQQRQMVG